MRRRSPRMALMLSGSVFLAGIASGALAGRAAVARAQDPYLRLDLFAKVFATIQREYVDEVTSEQLVDAAIVGMAKSLDPHTRWLDEDQLAAVKTDTTGQTTGLGLGVVRSDEALIVDEVLPDSPAALTGLRPGDRILAVDGRPITEVPADEVGALFSGARGETAVLEVIRDGWDAPRTVSAAMDEVKRTIVRGELLRGDGAPVVYVRMTQFQEGAGADVRAEIERRLSEAGGGKEVAGVILDLRDNPGGLLTEAVAVVDLFVDDGVIVSTKDRVGDGDVHRATPGGFPADLRLVVLVNGMSASASEIVASAVQETKRGTLLGERTYGKGSVQQVYVHSAEHALKLTVGRYFTASGAPVADREGRTPDVVVPFPVAPTPSEALDRELRAVPGLTDMDRTHLLELLADVPAQKRARPEIPWDRTAAALLPDDPQLTAAVKALRTP